MNQKSYKLITLMFVFALVLGMFAAMAPATAEASGMGGKTGYMHGGKAYFKPNELPNPFVRDFDGDCEWWKYELKGGHYVRTYCLCKYGDQEISYRKNVRGMWANYTYSEPSAVSE